MAVAIEQLKTCSKCRRDLPWDCFGRCRKNVDGLKYACKGCRKKDGQRYYEANREEVSVRNRKWKSENRDRVLEKGREYYEAHGAAYREANKEAISERNRRYRESQDRDEVAEYNRRYQEENREELNRKRVERRRGDDNLRILHSVRTRMSKVLKGGRKSARTVELLGCTIEFLRSHLESQFREGMSWDNYGEWHIDHIIPCANFDMTDPEQQKQCFHHSNLQPLWAYENYQKGCSL